MQYHTFQLPSNYWEQTCQLRLNVFVEEQGVPEELEIDEFDATAQHFIVIKNEQVIGTLRLILTESTAKLGRLVVKKSERHRGIASALMQEAELFCLQHKIRKIKLDAQITAKAFYQKLEYHEFGDIFLDAGIPHIRMIKMLSGAHTN